VIFSAHRLERSSVVYELHEGLSEFRKEIPMATKKSTKASSKAVLKFNPEWIKDPAPPFFRGLDRVSQRKLAEAKREFINTVKEVLRTGQG
jgi:hypothetical protein